MAEPFNPNKKGGGEGGSDPTKSNPRSTPLSSLIPKRSESSKDTKEIVDAITRSGNETNDAIRSQTDTEKQVFKDQFKGLRKSFTALSSELGRSFKTLQDIGKSSKEERQEDKRNLKELFRDLSNSISTTIASAISSMSKQLKDIFKDSGGLIGWIKTILQGVIAVGVAYIYRSYKVFGVLSGIIRSLGNALSKIDFSMLFTKIQFNLGAIISNLSKRFSWFGTLAKQVENFAGYVSRILQNGQNFVLNIVDFFGGMVSKLSNSGGFVGRIVGFFRNIGEMFSNTTRFIGPLMESFSGVFSFVFGKGGLLRNFMAGILKLIRTGSVIGKFAKWIPLLGWVITGIEALIGFAKGFFSSTGNFFDNVYDGLVGAVSQIISGLTFGLIDFEQATKLFKAILIPIKIQMKLIFGILGFVWGLIKTIFNVIKGILDPIIELVTEIFTVIAEVVEEIWNLLDTYVLTPIFAVIDVIAKAIGFVLKIVALSIFKPLIWLVKIIGWNLKMIFKAIRFIIDLIIWPYKTLYNVVSSLISGAKDFLVGIFVKPFEFIVDMVSGLVDTAGNMLYNIFVWPFETIWDYVTSIFSNLSETAAEIIDWVTSPSKWLGSIGGWLFGGDDEEEEEEKPKSSGRSRVTRDQDLGVGAEGEEEQYASQDRINAMYANTETYTESLTSGLLGTLAGTYKSIIDPLGVMETTLGLVTGTTTGTLSSVVSNVGGWFSSWWNGEEKKEPVTEEKKEPKLKSLGSGRVTRDQDLGIVGVGAEGELDEINQLNQEKAEESKSFFGGLWDSLKSALGSVMSYTKYILDPFGIWEGTIDLVSNTVGGIGSWLSSWWSGEEKKEPKQTQRRRVRLVESYSDPNDPLGVANDRYVEFNKEEDRYVVTPRRPQDSRSIRAAEIKEENLNNNLVAMRERVRERIEQGFNYRVTRDQDLGIVSAETPQEVETITANEQEETLSLIEQLWNGVKGGFSYLWEYSKKIFDPLGFWDSASSIVSLGGDLLSGLGSWVTGWFGGEEAQAESESINEKVAARRAELRREKGFGKKFGQYYYGDDKSTFSENMRPYFMENGIAVDQSGKRVTLVETNQSEVGGAALELKRYMESLDAQINEARDMKEMYSASPAMVVSQTTNNTSTESFAMGEEPATETDSSVLRIITT